MRHQAVTCLYFTRLLSFALLILIAATAANAAVTLEWDPNDPSPDGYRLFRRLDGDAYDYNAPLGTVTDTRFVDDTIVAGETYHYVVRAYEGADESGDSNEVSYTAPSESSGSDNDGGTNEDDGATNDGGTSEGGGTTEDTNEDTTDTVTDQETPETRIGLTPLLSATMSVDGHEHEATRWQISLDANFSQLVLDQVSAGQLTRYAVPDMVLETETVYFWRAAFLDASDQVLAQSSLASFETIAATDTDDADANGLVDTQEVSGSQLDLDGNGVNDADQSDLACVATETGDGHIGLKVADSGAMVVGLKSVCATQIAHTRNLPEMTDFGAVSFKLYLQEGQDEATVTVYFSEPAPEDTEWFKYNAELGWQLYEDAEFSPDRRSVSYTLTDGGSGDDDGVVNGIIIDPAGLGYRQAADSVDDTTNAAAGSSPSSGGSCFVTASAAPPTSGCAPLVALLIVLAAAALLKRARPRHSAGY